MPTSKVFVMPVAGKEQNDLGKRITPSRKKIFDALWNSAGQAEALRYGKNGEKEG